MEGEGDIQPIESVAGPRLIHVKRRRTPRVTSGQTEALINKLEGQPHLVTRKFTGFHGRENFETGWKQVALQLNQLPNGSVKTADQWLTVWRDLKSRACAKYAKLKRERTQTGNRGVSTPPLTELEKRILSIIGPEYSGGSDCPDSMAEEHIVQQEMAEVVTIDVDVEEPPMSPLSITAEVMTPEHNYSGNLPAQNTITAEVMTPEHNYSGNLPAQNIPNHQSRTATVPQGPAQRGRSRRNRNLNPRHTVAEQHASARKDFLAIAQSNAESMKMLAAATESQAEAAKMQAEAAKIQAEASLLFAQAANKIADAMLAFVNK